MKLGLRVDALRLALHEVKHGLHHPSRCEDLAMIGNTFFRTDHIHSVTFTETYGRTKRFLGTWKTSFDTAQLAANTHEHYICDRFSLKAQDMASFSGFIRKSPSGRLRTFLEARGVKAPEDFNWTSEGAGSQPVRSVLSGGGGLAGAGGASGR